jgi:hypothetical protein
VDPLHDLGKAQGRGTTVTFWTDPTLFGSASFDRETVATRLKEIVYLVAGLRLSLRDEREDPPFEAVYRFPGGGLRPGALPRRGQGGRPFHRSGYARRHGGASLSCVDPKLH